MRSRPEFRLVYPHLIKQELPNKKDLLDVDNIEFGLLTLPEEAWKSFLNPDILKKEDETFITGNAMIDELETMLSEGADINDILRKFEQPTKQPTK